MGKLRVFAASTLVSLLMLSTAVAASSSRGSDIARISTLRNEWVDALNRGDIVGVMAGLGDGAVVMPGTIPPRFGDAAIRSWYQTIFDQNRIQYHFETESFEMEGEWAVERWLATVSITPLAGVKTTRSSKIFADRGVRVYRRQADRSWKIDREAWFGELGSEFCLASLLGGEDRLQQFKRGQP